MFIPCQNKSGWPSAVIHHLLAGVAELIGDLKEHLLHLHHVGDHWSVKGPDLA
jgi:hypothetical protein